MRPRKIKINKSHLFIGISAIIVSLFFVWWNWQLWNVTFTGDLIRTPIVETTGTLRHPNQGIIVVINGERLYSRGYKSTQYSIGDTVAVRHISGISAVVQEGIGLNFIYIESFLGFIFFVLGSIIVVLTLIRKAGKKNKTIN